MRLEVSHRHKDYTVSVRYFTKIQMDEFPEYFECDCCGYKTLREGGGDSYEICYLCNWEDEISSSFFFIDKVIGGANFDYSLEEARENFHKYYTMYRIADPEQYFKIFHEVIEAKKKIILRLMLIDMFRESEYGNIDGSLEIEYLHLKLAREELEEAEEKVGYSINVRTGKIGKRRR